MTSRGRRHNSLKALRVQIANKLPGPLEFENCLSLFAAFSVRDPVNGRGVK